MPTKSEAQLLNQPLAKPGMLLRAHWLGKLFTIYFLPTGTKTHTFQLARKLEGLIRVKGQFLE